MIFICMTYVRVSGRFVAQLSVLTGSDNIGNYNTHAIGRIVVGTGSGFKAHEVPVLTGNAMKHWHAVYLARAYESLGGTMINELCRAGLGLRGYKKDATLSNLDYADSETEAIKDVCNDLHGFLIAVKKEKKQTNRSKKTENEEEQTEEETKKGVQIKRDSLIKFSFAAPVLDTNVLEFVSRFSVVHNRVDPVTQRQQGKKQSQDQQAEQKTQQMIFKQEYSTSPLYGFNVVMDLAYVCKPMYESSSVKICDDNEVLRRKEAAILALLYMFTGVGSKQARALPVSEVVELMAAVSDSPIPNLVHGSYMDYAEKSLDLLKAYAKSTGKQVYVVCYNVKSCVDQQASAQGQQKANPEVKTVNSLEEFFNELLTRLKGQQSSGQAGGTAQQQGQQ